MLIRIQKGEDAKDAARAVVSQQSMPLLGATAVAIMAFAAIGLSEDGTGEYCRSLFKVVCISLGLSWLTAVTVTPVLCVMFLKAPEKGQAESDSYGGRFYGSYRGLLATCIRFRGLTVGVVAAGFAAALWGFGYIDDSFFPDSTRPQFMVDFWLPQGTHIDDTTREAQEVEEYLRGLDGVTHVTSCIGGGAMRFLLTYDPEKTNSGSFWLWPSELLWPLIRHNFTNDRGRWWSWRSAAGWLATCTMPSHRRSFRPASLPKPCPLSGKAIRMKDENF